MNLRALNARAVSLGALCGAGFWIASVYPPSLWLSMPGAVLLLTAYLANLARTGNWRSWPPTQRSFNRFERWVGESGAVLLACPLVVVLARTWLAL